MLLEISGMDDSNKFSRWFSYVLGAFWDINLYMIHVHFYVIGHPGFILELPKLIVYDNCFQLAKKCNRVVLCTHDFLFLLAFCELASANFKPC